MTIKYLKNNKPKNPGQEPRKPNKPKKPLQEIKQTKQDPLFTLDNYCSLNLTDILDKIEEDNLDASKVSIYVEAEIEDIRYGSCNVNCRITYNGTYIYKVPDREYVRLLQIYEKQLKSYAKKMETYKKKVPIYLEQKEAFDKWWSQEVIKKKKLTFERLREELENYK